MRTTSPSDREGLSTPPAQRTFRTPTRSMGLARVGLDKATQLAAELEDEEIIRQLSRST